MIAKIIKITNKIRNNSPEYKSIQGYSYNLPLFSCKLDYAFPVELSEYVLQLYTIKNGVRYPVFIPILNEDDFRKINIYMDWMISEDIDLFEFIL